MWLYCIINFCLNTETCFFGKMTKILVKFILFWSKFHFFGWLFLKNSYKPGKYLSKFLFYSSYKIRTARSQNCLLIKHSSFFLRKNKETGFSGRLVEFHFVLNIAKNSYLKSIFWWNKFENQKLQTFVFKMRHCTWCSYVV